MPTDKDYAELKALARWLAFNLRGLRECTREFGCNDCGSCDETVCHALFKETDKALAAARAAGLLEKSLEQQLIDAKTMGLCSCCGDEPCPEHAETTNAN